MLRPYLGDIEMCCNKKATRAADIGRNYMGLYCNKMTLFASASCHFLGNLDPSECLTLGFETVVGGLYEIDTIVAYLLWRPAFGADL